MGRKTSSARAVLAVGACALLLAGVPARAATMVWQALYRGGAARFDWGHVMSLDEWGRRLYVAGKVANTGSSSDLWVNGYDAQTGAPAWSAPLQQHLADTPDDGTALSEEMVSGLASWSGGNLAAAGRYAAAASGWAANRAAIGYNGPLLGSDDIPGTLTPAGFAPPSRGMATIIRPNFQTAWTVSLASSPAYSIHYSFAEYNSNGSKISELRFPVLRDVDPNWSGDCCYDPPSRAAVDASGNLFALLGSRYTSLTGYDFLFGRLSADGSLTVWHYDGTGHGKDVADALAVSPAGRMFILAKTSETDSGFATRLLAFDAAGGLLWRTSPQWSGVPIEDATLTLSPNGTLWVTESATGRSLVYSQGGVLIRQDVLPLPPGVQTYIGQITADRNENIYAVGGSNGELWVAEFNGQPAAPPKAPCSLSAYNYPNPFRNADGQTSIHYKLPEDSDVTVTIYDLTGGMVRFWNFRSGDNGGRAGDNAVAWDGNRIGGQKTSTGMYLASVKAKTPACQEIARIGVVH